MRLNLEELYRHHYAVLYCHALRLGVHPNDVEDRLQDTFLAAQRGLENFEGRSSPLTWLVGILRNTVCSTRTREERRRRKHANYEHVVLFAEPHHSAETQLAVRLLSDFLMSTNPERRKVFVLADIEGWKGREIAAALKINQNAANYHLRQARIEFARRFDSPEERRLAPSALFALGIEINRPVQVTVPMWTTYVSLMSVAVAVVSLLGIAHTTKSARLDPLATTHHRVPPSHAGQTIADPDQRIEVPDQTIDDNSEAKAKALPPEPDLSSDAHPAPTKRPRPRPSPPTIGSISEVPRSPEVQLPKAPSDRFLLTQARQALDVGDPAAALAYLDAVSLPDFEPKARTKYRVEALCDLKEFARAQFVVDGWNAEHPEAMIQRCVAK